MEPAATSRSASSTRSYTKALKEANALDFDDLLLKTVELFEKSASRARALREEVPLRDGGRVPGHQPAAVPARFSGTLATHRNLCVVGDPDQSIYKWRGADLRNILDFEHDFPEVDDRRGSSGTTARRR